MKGGIVLFTKQNLLRTTGILFFSGEIEKR